MGLSTQMTYLLVKRFRVPSSGCQSTFALKGIWEWKTGIVIRFTYLMVA